MTKGTVRGVIANMVTLRVDGPVRQGEICYIETGGDKLMSEVIKVVGQDVYVQVFESTRGLKVGATAEFTGHMLEVQLAPGMLSKNFDGLQNDLDKMEGVFLRRGQYTDPLDRERLWDFEPIAKVGDKVEASAWLGKVEENSQPLKIMAPFQMQGTATVKSIAKAGQYRVEDTIATLTLEDGTDLDVNMIQHWPVTFAMTNYRVPSSFWRPASAPSTPSTPSSRAARDSSPDLSERVRPCFSTPSPSRPKPTSSSSQPAVSVPTRSWKSSPSSRNS